MPERARITASHADAVAERDEAQREENLLRYGTQTAPPPPRPRVVVRRPAAQPAASAQPEPAPRQPQPPPVEPPPPRSGEHVHHASLPAYFTRF